MKDEKGHGSNGRGGSPLPAMARRLQSQIKSGLMKPAISDQGAKAALASGPKSADVPVHEAMAGDAWSQTPGGDRGQEGTAGAGAGKDAWSKAPGGDRPNAWGQSPKDAKAARKQIRDSKRQGKMRSYP